MPLFSVITPVFNTPLFALEQCLSSVLKQSFTDWELILIDDASTDSTVKTVLSDCAASDNRVKVITHVENRGISAASQSGVDIARGTFIALLDHDDELASTALEDVAAVLELYPECDYIYSDEDKIGLDGNHFDEFLKPDWSPERLRGQNYCCHLSVIRKSLVDQVGGFRQGFDGSQDYDLILRVTEKSRQIHHIPKVLYHWRVVPGSTALSTSEKPESYSAAARALTDHLARLNIDGQVIDAGFGYHEIIRQLKTKPRVSVIIPTCGVEKVVFGERQCLIENTLRSLSELTDYENVEVVVVADSHTPPLSLAKINATSHVSPKVVLYDKPFNFSDKCNVGFSHATGELILLLNDDIQPITPDWLTTMVGLAIEPDVGMVGPLLLLEDGRIQSASHSNTPSPHNFRNGHPSQQGGEFGILAVARECSGVTGAAALMRREVYMEVGGLSAQFPNCFNDVDLAFKVLEAGYRIIWTPHAKLYHFESVSRDATVDRAELELLMNRWGRFFDRDRFNRLN